MFDFDVKLNDCVSFQDCLRMGDYIVFQSLDGIVAHSFALVLHRFTYKYKSPVLRVPETFLVDVL